jgi:hypothetical protein
MAKKEAAKRLIRPKTPADYLARLPQFEPRPIPFADYDVQVQREQGIDVQMQREQRIDDVLSKFMAPYIRDATKLEPFLNDAKRAIRGYVGSAGGQSGSSSGTQGGTGATTSSGTQGNTGATSNSGVQGNVSGNIGGNVGGDLGANSNSGVQGNTGTSPNSGRSSTTGRGTGNRERETEYDRRKAKKLLSATSIALETTKRKLQEINQWPELSDFLKRLYQKIARWPELSELLKPLHRDATLAERPQPLSRKQVKQELRRRADLDRSYSDIAPDRIRWRLSQLEAVVSLAAERVTFGPGDAQRDQIAQDFTDQLASAWHRATETWPTCSKPTRRLKNPSPFVRLLKTINQELLMKRHRSPNNFFEYGAKAIKRLRQFIEPDC